MEIDNIKVKGDFWKWAFIISFGINSFVLGGYSVNRKIETHSNISGHPVLETRVLNVESDIREIRDDMKSILVEIRELGK